MLAKTLRRQPFAKIFPLEIDRYESQVGSKARGGQPPRFQAWVAG